ncbi:MAG: PspC family transcriptional regulator [Bacteroidia bacterium]
MKKMEVTRTFFEKQAFGVCTWLGEKLDMKSSVIRLFFIYASCLTIGSPLIIYMTIAFWLKMKNYVRDRRTSVWDL